MSSPNPATTMTEPLISGGKHSDPREYVMLAVRGHGECPLTLANRSAVCKSEDHKHAVAKRHGFDSASTWIAYMRSEGWAVKVMDRVY